MFQLPDAPLESTGRLSKHNQVYAQAVGAHISIPNAPISLFN